jgi:predicted GIY-YIG superfamily endonuclease
MRRKKAPIQFDNQAIRDWTLYVIRLTNGDYYIGITSRKDFMRRIRQHGGRTGAKVNRGKVVEEIIEVQHLGKISGLKAQSIENDMMLDYRKRFGARKVRGGYDISQKTPIIPTYTPGSWQAMVFIFSSLILALLLLIMLSIR